MITAKKARELSTDSSVLDSILENAYGEIESAAFEGMSNTSIEISPCMNRVIVNKVINTLVDSGFTVKRFYNKLLIFWA